MVTDHVWGVDVGESKVAFAAIPVHGPGQVVRALHIGSPRGARRLALLARAVEDLARLLAQSHPPVTVWVEQPVGRIANPHLMAAWGVTLAASYRALEPLYPFPVSVIAVTPPCWKKGIGIGGNATKDAVLAWAGREGYDGADQDCADALGIATYGRAATLDV